MISRFKKEVADSARCVASVTADGAWHSHQCKKPRGHGPDGEWCASHAKVLAGQQKYADERKARHDAANAERARIVGAYGEIADLAKDHLVSPNKHTSFENIVRKVAGIYDMQVTSPQIFADTFDHLVEVGDRLVIMEAAQEFERRKKVELVALLNALLPRLTARKLAQIAREAGASV